MTDLTMLEEEYLAEFPDILNQVISEVFDEPVMVAGGIHLRILFITEQIIAAAVAGCAAGFSTLQAVAGLCFLEFNRSHQSTSRLQRLGNKRLRTRHADLQKLCERTFALIKEHVDSESSEFQIFSKTLTDEMMRAIEPSA